MERPGESLSDAVLSSLLVVEVFENAMRLQLLVSKNRQRVYSIARHSLIEGSFVEPADVLRGLVRLKVDRVSQHPIALVMHSGLLSTICSSAVLMRSDPSSQIALSEIENLIGSALWKLLNKERKGAAQKLSIPETDVVISAVTILGVKLDKHRVQNPLGFKAHAVEFECRYHCLSRTFLKELERLIPEDRLVAMMELGSSEAALMESSNALFAEVAERSTILFRIRGREVRYYDTIPWGSQHVITALEESLAISPQMAERLLALRDAKTASSFFLKKLEALIQGEVSLLWKGIASQMAEARANTWGYCLLCPLPEQTETIPALKRANLLPAGVKIDTLVVGNRTGFHLQLNGSIRSLRDRSISSLSEVSTFSALVHAQQVGNYSALTKIATRRARWLQST